MVCLGILENWYKFCGAFRGRESLAGDFYLCQACLGAVQLSILRLALVCVLLHLSTVDVYVNLVISFDLSSASGYLVGGTALHPCSSSSSGKMQNQCVLETGGGHKARTVFR